MGIVDKVKDFITNTKRVVRVARRPTAKEVNLIARVSGIGILIVGGISFLIQILGNLVNQFFQPPDENALNQSFIMIGSIVLQGMSPLSWLQLLGDPATIQVMQAMLVLVP